MKQVLTNLRQTGIKTWMLTGDKTLTAISIAKSTGLSKSGDALILFTGDALKNKARAINKSQEEAAEILLYEAICMQMDMIKSKEDMLSYNA